jgi:ribosomal protein S18 acetylase RimI-like enzyme
MVREMRTLVRIGWIGWALSRLLLPPAARPLGFVWEEDDQIVGNASLLPVSGHPRRWVMANVAVHPDYRRRGIAREMVGASDELALKAGADAIYLQVERHNEAALTLYRSMGYEPLTTRTTWRRSRGLPHKQSPKGTTVRQRRASEWTEQFALAEQVSPEGLVWPHPLEPDYFRPTSFGQFFGREAKLHLVRREGGRLAGSLSVHGTAVQRFVLLVDPGLQGQIEEELVTRALNQVHARQRSILLDYPADVAVETLRELGFREERALTWMRHSYR